jgi:hypothetical protein
VAVDCTDLASDIAERIAAGESLADLWPDLYYAILAEVEAFLRKLFELIRIAMEANMPSSDTIRPSNSPESLNILPDPNDLRSGFFSIGKWKFEHPDNL